MCEIPSCRASAVFTGFLLGGGSLPPDFANRCVKSQAVVLTRCLQVLCSVAAHFRQILPADLWNPEPLFSRSISRFFARSRLTSARFCQQMCEITSHSFNVSMFVEHCFFGQPLLFPLDIVRNREHFSGEAVWSWTKAYESRSCVRHIIIPVTTHCHTLVLLLLHSHT